jgi:hypothetical protein
MVRRARRGAEREHLFFQEGEHAVAGEDRRRRLEQKCLVGRAAALGDEQEFVFVIGAASALGIELDLRWHVRAGVFLLEHRQRCQLRIAQIAFEIRIARALGERRLVIAAAPDQPALLAHDDRGAGVLAHRQHTAGGNIRVLEKFVSDELVIIRGFGVFDDRFQRSQMRRAEQMIDVAERGLRERAQRLARHHHYVFAEDALDAHAEVCAILGDLAIGRVVLAERKQRRVFIRRRRMGADGGVHGQF